MEVTQELEPRDRLRQIVVDLAYGDISRMKLIEQAKEVSHLIHHLLAPDRLTTRDIDLIARQVGAYFGIDAHEIRGRSRTHHISQARQIVVYIALKHEANTLEAVGSSLNRDHTTIIYLRDRCKANYQRDPSFARRVDELERHVAAAIQLREGEKTDD